MSRVPDLTCNESLPDDDSDHLVAPHPAPLPGQFRVNMPHPQPNPRPTYHATLARPVASRSYTVANPGPNTRPVQAGAPGSAAAAVGAHVGPTMHRSYTVANANNHNATVSKMMRNYQNAEAHDFGAYNHGGAHVTPRQTMFPSFHRDDRAQPPHNVNPMHHQQAAMSATAAQMNYCINTMRLQQATPAQTGSKTAQGALASVMRTDPTRSFQNQYRHNYSPGMMQHQSRLTVGGSTPVISQARYSGMHNGARAMQTPASLIRQPPQSPSIHHMPPPMSPAMHRMQAQLHAHLQPPNPMTHAIPGSPSPMHQIIQQHMNTPSPRPSILRKNTTPGSAAKRKLPFTQDPPLIPPLNGNAPSTSGTSPSLSVRNIIQTAAAGSTSVAKALGQVSLPQVPVLTNGQGTEPSPRKRPRKQQFDSSQPVDPIRMAIGVEPITTAVWNIPPGQAIPGMFGADKKRGRPRSNSTGVPEPIFITTGVRHVFVPMEGLNQRGRNHPQHQQQQSVIVPNTPLAPQAAPQAPGPQKKGPKPKADGPKRAPKKPPKEKAPPKPKEPKAPKEPRKPKTSKANMAPPTLVPAITPVMMERPQPVRPPTKNTPSTNQQQQIQPIKQKVVPAREKKLPANTKPKAKGTSSAKTGKPSTSAVVSSKQVKTEPKTTKTTTKKSKKEEKPKSPEEQRAMDVASFLAVQLIKHQKHVLVQKKIDKLAKMGQVDMRLTAKDRALDEFDSRWQSTSKAAPNKDTALLKKRPVDLIAVQCQPSTSAGMLDVPKRQHLLDVMPMSASELRANHFKAPENADRALRKRNKLKMLLRARQRILHDDERKARKYAKHLVKENEKSQISILALRDQLNIDPEARKASKRAVIEGLTQALLKRTLANKARLVEPFDRALSKKLRKRRRLTKDKLKSSNSINKKGKIAVSIKMVQKKVLELKKKNKKEKKDKKKSKTPKLSSKKVKQSKESKTKLKDGKKVKLSKKARLRKKYKFMIPKVQCGKKVNKQGVAIKQEIEESPVEVFAAKFTKNSILLKTQIPKDAGKVVELSAKDRWSLWKEHWIRRKIRREEEKKNPPVKKAVVKKKIGETKKSTSVGKKNEKINTINDAKNTRPSSVKLLWSKNVPLPKAAKPSKRLTIEQQMENNMIKHKQNLQLSQETREAAINIIAEAAHQINQVNAGEFFNNHQLKSEETKEEFEQASIAEDKIKIEEDEPKEVANGIDLTIVKAEAEEIIDVVSEEIIDVISTEDITTTVISKKLKKKNNKKAKLAKKLPTKSKKVDAKKKKAESMRGKVLVSLKRLHFADRMDMNVVRKRMRVRALPDDVIIEQTLDQIVGTICMSEDPTDKDAVVERTLMRLHSRMTVANAQQVLLARKAQGRIMEAPTFSSILNEASEEPKLPKPAESVENSTSVDSSMTEKAWWNLVCRPVRMESKKPVPVVVVSKKKKRSNSLRKTVMKKAIAPAVDEKPCRATEDEHSNKVTVPILNPAILAMKATTRDVRPEGITDPCLTGTFPEGFIDMIKSQPDKTADVSPRKDSKKKTTANSSSKKPSSKVDPPLEKKENRKIGKRGTAEKNVKIAESVAATTQLHIDPIRCHDAKITSTLSPRRYVKPAPIDDPWITRAFPTDFFERATEAANDPTTIAQNSLLRRMSSTTVDVTAVGKMLALKKVKTKKSKLMKKKLKKKLKKQAKLKQKNGELMKEIKMEPGVITKKMKKKLVKKASTSTKKIVVKEEPRDEEDITTDPAAKSKTKAKPKKHMKTHKVRLASAREVAIRQLEQRSKRVQEQSKLEEQVLQMFEGMLETYDPEAHWKLLLDIARDFVEGDDDATVRRKRFLRLRMTLMLPPCEPFVQKMPAWGEPCDTLIISPTVAQVNTVMKGLSPFWKGVKSASNPMGLYINREGHRVLERDDRYVPLTDDHREFYYEDVVEKANPKHLEKYLQKVGNLKTRSAAMPLLDSDEPEQLQKKISTLSRRAIAFQRNDEVTYPGQKKSDFPPRPGPDASPIAHDPQLVAKYKNNREMLATTFKAIHETTLIMEQTRDALAEHLGLKPKRVIPESPVKVEPVDIKPRPMGRKQLASLAKAAAAKELLKKKVPKKAPKVMKKETKRRLLKEKEIKKEIIEEPEVEPVVLIVAPPPEPPRTPKKVAVKQPRAPRTPVIIDSTFERQMRRAIQESLRQMPSTSKT